MKFLVLTLAGLLTAGCTINVVDKRLSREEVIQAFGQRDKVLEKIIAVIEKQQKDYPPKAEVKK